MLNLQERRNRRHFFQSPIFSILLLTVASVIANSVYGIYKKDQVANINRIESERKLNILKDKEERLQTEIAKLKTSRGIEEELRSKFQVTKNGEEVLVVVDDPVSATDASQTPRDGDGIWGKFLKLIGF